MLEIKNWHSESHLHPPELREGRGRGVRDREVGVRQMDGPRLLVDSLGFTGQPKAGKRREKNLQLDAPFRYLSLFRAYI